MSASLTSSSSQSQDVTGNKSTVTVSATVTINVGYFEGFQSWGRININGTTYSIAGPTYMAALSDPHVAPDTWTFSKSVTFNHDSVGARGAIACSASFDIDGYSAHNCSSDTGDQGALNYDRNPVTPTSTALTRNAGTTSAAGGDTITAFTTTGGIANGTGTPAPPAVSYTFLYSTASAGTYTTMTPLTVSSTNTASSYAVAAAPAGLPYTLPSATATYYFKVGADNTDDAAIKYGPIITKYGVPPAPTTGPTLGARTSSSTGVTVTSTAVTSLEPVNAPVTGYEYQTNVENAGYSVFSALTQGGTFNVPATSTVSIITRAINSAGKGLSSTASTSYGVPTTPVQAALTRPTSTTLRISHSTASTFAYGTTANATSTYQYRISINGGAYGAWTNIAGTASTVDVGITTTNTYAVQTQSTSSQSTISATSTAVTSYGTPTTPTGLALSRPTTTTLRILTNADSTAANGTTIADYEYALSTDNGAYGAWTSMGIDGTIDIASVITSTYAVKVRAKSNQLTYSPESSIVTDLGVSSVPAAPTLSRPTTTSLRIQSGTSSPAYGTTITDYEYALSTDGGAYGTWTSLGVDGLIDLVATYTTTYAVKTRAKNSNLEYSSESASTTIYGSPTTTAAPTVSRPTTTSLRIQSGTSTAANGTTITDYEYALSTDGGAYGAWTSLGIDGLIDLVAAITSTYAVKTRAKSSQTTYGLDSTITTSSGVPSAPSAAPTLSRPTRTTLRIVTATATPAYSAAIIRYEYALSTNAGAYGAWTTMGASVATTIDISATVTNTYTVKTRAVDASNNGLESTSSTTFGVPTQPAAPTVIRANTTATSITITPSASTAATGTSITDYQFAMSVNNGAYGPWVSISVSGATISTYNSVSIATLSNYVVKTRAAGGYDYSDESPAYTLKAWPTAPTFGVGQGASRDPAISGRIDLSWTAPSSTDGLAITGYNIYQKLSADASFPTTPTYTTTGTGTTRTVTGLTYGYSYDYKIGARTSAVDAVSNALPPLSTTVTNYAGGTTFPPTNIAVTQDATTTGKVRVYWTKPDEAPGAIISYNVYDAATDVSKYSGTGETTTNLITNSNFEVDTTGWQGAGLTIYRDTIEKYSGLASLKSVSVSQYQDLRTNSITVLPSTTYTISYRIKGENLKSVATEVYQSGGTTLYGSAVSTNGLWQYASFTFTTSAGITSIQPVVKNYYAGAHTYYIDEVLLEQSSTVNGYFEGTKVHADVTGLTANSSTQYSYYVTATNAYGTSNASLDSNLIYAPGPTPAPTIGTLTQSTTISGKQTLTWTKPSTEVAGEISSYTVYNASTNALVGTVTSIIPADPATTIDITSLTPGTNYSYYVKANNIYGASVASSTSTSVQAPGSPGAPATIAVTKVSGVSRDLTIDCGISNGYGNAVSNYYIQYSTNGGSTWSTEAAMTSRSTTYIDLPAGLTYTFRCYSKNSVTLAANGSSPVAYNYISTTQYVPAIVKRYVGTTPTVSVVAKRYDSATSQWVKITTAKKYNGLTSQWEDLT